MTATTVTGVRSWRHVLGQRERLCSRLNIPAEIAAACRIEEDTKRRVEILLSTGLVLHGVCTISGGTELAIPPEFQDAFRQAEWFECQILGEETGESADLRLFDPSADVQGEPMLAESFDRALRAMSRRVPFRPFAVELTSGGRVEVDHPEALVFRGGVAVHISAEGVLTVFDHHSVARLINSTGTPAS